LILTTKALRALSITKLFDENQIFLVFLSDLSASVVINNTIDI